MTDPRTERDRTLRRVRGTTAAAGVGAVVVTGALAGWLGHTAEADTGSAVSTGTSSSTSGTGTLETPSASPTTDSSSGSDQPPVVTGGS